jgi:phosphoglycerate dehydrogenase-like enzyme
MPARRGRGVTGRRVLVVDLDADTPRWALPAEGLARLREAADDGWTVRVAPSTTHSAGDGRTVVGDELRAAAADAEVYFGFGLPPALVEAAPGLRWAQSAAAGVRGLLAPPVRTAVGEGRLVLTNAAGVMAMPIAEHVVGGVLHFLRGFDVAAAQQRARVWDRAPWAAPAPGGPDVMPREVGECRVVVVGVRGIGAAVAERLTALGAECVGVRRSAGREAPAGFARVVGVGEVDAALGAADVVVLAAPSTPETDGLLDARRLALLGAGAIVVNVGRGALVDEPALAAALAGGRLRGAVLDVAAREPLPPESPLWGLPNVLLTPHVSPTSPGRFWGRMLDLFVDNWGRYRRGAPLRNVVDVAAGY